MEGSAGQSEYIRAQIERARGDLVQVLDRIEQARVEGLAQLDRAVGESVAAIRVECGRICDNAAAASVARARKRAVGAALSLRAVSRNAGAQALCWLGLAFAVMWASASTATGIEGAIAAFVLAYAALVYWGIQREGERGSAAERAAIVTFRGMQPAFLAFDDKESSDPAYPYLGTIAPGGAEPVTKGFRIDKHYGIQFGATFLGMMGPDSRFRMLMRLPMDGFSPLVISFGEAKETDASWRVWQGLGSSLISAASVHAPLVRRYRLAVEELEGYYATQRLVTQRIRTLEGLDRERADVALPTQTLDRILKLVDLFKSGRQPSPKGMLLFGPPGTGKTLVARKLAKQQGCNFIAVGVADLKSEHIGGTGPRVKEVWERCRKNAPTLLFVDECESVFSARGGVASDKFSAELVQTFLSEWDGFNQSAGQVFVIGATNRRDLLDTAIMSRFTESIEFGPPDAEGRRRILGVEFEKARLSLQPDETIVRETAGMSGRDLHTLVSKVLAEHIDGEFTADEFVAEVRKLRGKSSTSVQQLGWGDVILPDATRAEFQSLGRELVHSEELRELNVQVPRGILLYGPPGTGKTQVARVLASQSGLSFLAASSSELKAGYTGQSGQFVRQLFDRARAQAPCILFIDEIDTVAGIRGNGDSFTTEIVAQLLQEIDGITTRNGQVFLLAASNRPDSIDPALLSRMERKIEIGLPDETARAAILQLQMERKPLDFDLKEGSKLLASRTEGMSGRDLQSLVTQATRLALQRAIATSGDPRNLSIRKEDFDAVLGDEPLAA